LNTLEQEKQEREARTAGRADVWDTGDVTLPPPQPLAVPPPDDETPINAPIQDVQPIDGETVMDPPPGMELHKHGQLQG